VERVIAGLCDSEDFERNPVDEENRVAFGVDNVGFDKMMSGSDDAIRRGGYRENRRKWVLNALQVGDEFVPLFAHVVEVVL
jgi:hypothetical protein